MMPIRRRVDDLNQEGYRISVREITSLEVYTCAIRLLFNPVFLIARIPEREIRSQLHRELA